jgi:DNA-directed RNA polymerase I subunit RPA2
MAAVDGRGASCSDADVTARLQELVRPHVESFDWFVRYGLDEGVESLEPEEFEAPGGEHISLWLDSATLRSPKSESRREQDLYPSECRRRSASYTGQLRAVLKYSVNGGPPLEFERALGQLPVMVRSVACHLRGLGPAELIRKREERHELGGYFIANGNERAIRLLIVPRRNHITGIVRPSFKNRGHAFTPFATVMRCANTDQCSLTVALHLLDTGSARLRITISKNEFFIPIVTLLRALRECSDSEIYSRAVGGAGSDSFVADRVLEALRENRDDFGEPLRTRHECLGFLGRRFRPVLRRPPWESDEDAGVVLLRRHVFIHLEHPTETGRGAAKWELLLLMLQRLYALAAGRVAQDNPDRWGDRRMGGIPRAKGGAGSRTGGVCCRRGTG